MANARVEVITSVQRRRRWSSAEKEQLVAATLEAGASVSAVARSAGVHRASCTGGGASCAAGRHRQASRRCG